ncbi:MAG: hypothetical protein WBG37_16365 [Desulfobacterales bacterium]
MGVLVGVVSNPAWAGGYHNIPGTACAAYNNYQANALERSHVRIYNPPTNGQSIWVICPVQRVEEDVVSTTNHLHGYINVFFSSQSASSAEVVCIYREFDYNTTHEPGGALTGVNDSVTVTATRPITVPGVDDVAFLLTNDQNYAYSYWTATCKLAPGTGINSIDADQE